MDEHPKATRKQLQEAGAIPTPSATSVAKRVPRRKAATRALVKDAVKVVKGGSRTRYYR